MRITYLHQYFVTRDSAGGTRSYEFARRLVVKGHVVTVITSGASLPSSMQTIRRVSRTEIDGIRLIVIPVPYSNEMSYRARMWSFARFALLASWFAARTPADLVFATSTPLSIAIPGFAGRVFQRAPMVFEVRDLWPEMPIAMGALRNPVARWAAGRLERLAYRASERVIALSPGMAQGVVRAGMNARRVSVVPNSCDVDLFDIPEAAGEVVRASVPGLNPGAHLVVYAGALGRVNGVEFLADVAAEIRTQVPDARFLIMGAGSGREAVLERAKARGVLNQTFFVREPVPKRDMPAVLAAATVVTSLFRPIPQMSVNSANKFFDGLAASRPVMINYGGWQAEILTETGAGLVVPGDDPRTAAATLAAFLASADRIAAARRAAADLANRRFHRDALAREFCDILERVAASHGTRIAGFDDSQGTSTM